MIEPGSTTTVKLTYRGRNYVRTDDGVQIYMLQGVIESLKWDPPPWEPEIGKPAWWVNEEVIVKGIDQDSAWVLDTGGDYYTVGVVNLSRPKENT
jgi:hypothetical protein